MDRTQVCGTCDPGSIPGGSTNNYKHMHLSLESLRKQEKDGIAFRAKLDKDLIEVEPFIDKIVADEEMCNEVSAFVKRPGNEHLNELYEISRDAILNDKIDPNDRDIDRSFIVRQLLCRLIIHKRDRASFDKIVDHLAQN